MSRIVPPSRKRQETNEDHQGDAGLPLRWALIVVASLAGGFAVGAAAGLVPGITVGLSFAGLLHRIVSKR